MPVPTRLNHSLLGSIGNTPLLELADGIFIKCEFLNPTGSIKDRIAKFMVDRAEREGLIKPGDTIVEATSGNTGNALSMVAAAKGYNMVMVMPNAFSMERVNIAKAFGAEVRLTEGFDVTDAKNLAHELGQQEGWWNPGQFDNEWNIESNRSWLGREMILQLPYGTRVDAIVQGIGTGGTLIGVGQELRKHNNPDLKVFALEPSKAPTLKEGIFEEHALEGIGDGFIPDIVQRNKDTIDDIVLVDDEEALATMPTLSAKFGTFVGPTSAANWLAAHKIRAQNPDIKTVLTFFCDTGLKYLSNHYSK